ncbi:MAG: DUF1206 domain-containing protein [Mycobacteriales bacterium]
MADMANKAGSAGRSGAARKIVLIGWAAKGVVYLALAYLVLQLAFGSAPQQATTNGALQYVAQTAPGAIAIVLLGVGLLAYAVGRVLEVTTLALPSIDAKDKAQAAVLALLYVSLALSAFSIVGLVSGSGSSGGTSTEKQGSTLLLGLPGGRVIVAVVGLVVVVAGLYQAYQGVQQVFLGTLRTGEMSGSLRSAAGKIGTVAYVTKGAILVLLGYFLVQSALTYDPSKARGLDAALREVAQRSWGKVVLVLVAVGLLAYALFTFLEARYRKVGVSATGTP